MQNDPHGEGALVHALHEPEATCLEALVPISASAGTQQSLHISGSACRDKAAPAKGTYAIKILFKASCWPFLLDCIGASARRPGLVLLIDAPEPPAPLRRQLMKDINRGVQLPCIVLASTLRDQPAWNRQFASHLSGRGYCASTLFLGDDGAASATPE